MIYLAVFLLGAALGWRLPKGVEAYRWARPRSIRRVAVLTAVLAMLGAGVRVQ